jgi:hypothetical protein
MSGRSAKRDNAAVVGVGAAACAVCCAGPILGFLAAIGLGTALGAAIFGVSALAIGALALVLVLRRRQHRLAACATAPAEAVPVVLGSTRARD